ncbi:hypothetical protein JCM5350_001663 [Sporobolomyces pararoseus]
MSESAILSGLTNLPPDTNPYLWIANWVEKSSRPDFSGNAKVQLFVIIGLLSFDILLMVCCIVVRCWKNQFWFFRRRMSKTLIQPNQINVLAVLAIAIIGLNILLLLSFVQAIDGKLPTYTGYLTFSFPQVLFADLAGEILVWGFAATFLIHLESTNSLHLNSLSDDDSEQHLERWILPCNVVGILTPLLHLAIFTPLGVIGGSCYQKIINEDRSASTSAANLDRKFSLISLIKLAFWLTALLFQLKQLLVVSKILFFLVACSTLSFSLYYAIRPLDQSQSIVFASFWIQPVLSTVAASCVLYHCISSPADGPSPNKDPPSSLRLPSSSDKSEVTKELDFGFVREGEESIRGPYLTTSFVEEVRPLAYHQSSGELRRKVSDVNRNFSYL